MLAPLGNAGLPFDYGAVKTWVMVFFFVVFAFILLRLATRGSAHYRRASRLPLDDDQEHGDRASGSRQGLE